MLWLLSLYPLRDFQCMMDPGFKSLIKSPTSSANVRNKLNRYNLTMSLSYHDGDILSAACILSPSHEAETYASTPCSHANANGNNDGYQYQMQISQGLPKLRPKISESESHDHHELFMSYHNRMYHRTSNKYSLKIKPWSMNNITHEQTKKLLKVQQMKF